MTAVLEEVIQSDGQTVAELKPTRGALQYVAGALPNRPALPILACVVLTGDGTGLHLGTFDYDVSRTAHVPGQSVAPFRVAVNGKRLLDILKVADGATVTFTEQSSQMIVRSGSDEWSLQTQPIDDYPMLPVSAGADQWLTVGISEFLGVISGVASCARRDDTLPVLETVCFDVENGALSLCSTDRYRMGFVQSWATVPQPDRRVLAPAGKLLAAVKALVKVGADSVTVSTRDGNMFLQCGGYAASLRLEDGEFPRWRMLVPSEFQSTVTFDAKPFKASLKKAAIVADRNTPVRVTVNGACSFTAGCGDEAQAEIPLPGAIVSGEPFTIGFNPGFMGEAPAVTGGGAMVLNVVSPVKPAVFTGEGAVSMLIMPVRLSG